jgi:hypothetical protein
MTMGASHSQKTLPVAGDVCHLLFEASYRFNDLERRKDRSE